MDWIWSVAQWSATSLQIRITFLSKLMLSRSGSACMIPVKPQWNGARGISPGSELNEVCLGLETEDCNTGETADSEVTQAPVTFF